MADINLRGYLCDNDTADVYRYWGWRDITCPSDIADALEVDPADLIHASVFPDAILRKTE